jgi:hypothetical protein
LAIWPTLTGARIDHFFSREGTSNMKQLRASRLLPKSYPAQLLLLAVVTQLTIGFTSSPAYAGNTPPSPKEQPRQAALPPRVSTVATELAALSTSAEEIFELAVAGKMDRIGKKLEGLRKNVASLAYLQGQSNNNMLLPRLGHTVAELEEATNAKDRLEVMRYANRITLIAATVEVPLKPIVPTEVSLLDYNGRELAIWSEMKKTEKLSNIVMRMHLAWQTLMPKLIEHNGTKELRRFSEVMGRLEMARTPEEYARLSRQVPPEIDTIKAVFARAAK